MQFVPSGFGKKNRAFFSSDVSQTPETFIFPPFPRREEAPVLGALGRDPHAYVRALTERQQQEMERKGRRCREGKTVETPRDYKGSRRRVYIQAAHPGGWCWRLPRAGGCLQQILREAVCSRSQRGQLFFWQEPRDSKPYLVLGSLCV